MKNINKLLTLIIYTYNVNCTEYREITSCENNQSKQNINIILGEDNIINSSTNDTTQGFKHSSNKNMKAPNNKLYNIINVKNYHGNKNIIKSNNNIQHSNNNVINIQSDNEYKNMINVKYNTYKRSKSLPIMHTINNINTRQHKLSYDLAKQRNQIEYLKQALSENYYKNSYPISSPALYHDTITNAETEQSTVNFTHNNIDDYNSIISKNEICQILSTMTHEQSNFDIFMKSNNLGYHNQTELLLSKHWFETWKDDWEYVKNNILNQDCKNGSCEVVVARILYKTVHYFQKFIREIMKYRNNFKSINKSYLLKYIKDDCINNDKFLSLDNSDMTKNRNITYTFIKNNKVYTDAITYMMHKTIKLLQDLLLALSNKPYGSILQLKPIVNAFHSEYYNNNGLEEKLKQSIEKYKQKMSNYSKEYEKNRNNIQTEKIKANNLQNELNDKKYEISQYEYWITQKCNENEFNLKLNECKKEYDNIILKYKNTCSNIEKLKNYESQLINHMKELKSKIIKYNSRYYTLDYINNNKTKELVSKLLGQVEQIKHYLNKYCNSSNNLILFLSKNIQLNNDNKILLKYLYNNVNNNYQKQLFNKMNSGKINIDNNKKPFNILDDNIITSNNKQSFNKIESSTFNILDNNINTNNNKQLLNTAEVNNVIYEINQLCTEIEKQKENIKYYIVLLKEVMKQIFSNNSSYKNKINQFV